MRLRLKPGIRALGIAECFRKHGRRAVLAGVVMRADLQIDGFGLGEVTVGGMDATEGVIELWSSMRRRDVNVIMLNGCIISMFNLVDLEEVHRATSVPVVCVSYEPTRGIEGYLRELPEAERRLRVYRRLGPREEVELPTGHRVFVRCAGAEVREVKVLLARFTKQGGIPEPLKTARLLARAVLRWREGEKLRA